MVEEVIVVVLSAAGVHVVDPSDRGLRRRRRHPRFLVQRARVVVVDEARVVEAQLGILVQIGLRRGMRDYLQVRLVDHHRGVHVAGRIRGATAILRSSDNCFPGRLERNEAVGIDFQHLRIGTGILYRQTTGSSGIQVDRMITVGNRKITNHVGDGLELIENGYSENFFKARVIFVCDTDANAQVGSCGSIREVESERTAIIEFQFMVQMVPHLPCTGVGRIEMNKVGVRLVRVQHLETSKVLPHFLVRVIPSGILRRRIGRIGFCEVIV